MIIALTAGVHRKEGRPRFGSDGASCSLEIALDEGELTKLPELKAKIRHVMALCREAVEEELERTRPAEAAELHPDPDDDIRPGDPPYERQYAAPVAYPPPAPGPTWTPPPPPALAGPPPAADNGRQYAPPKTGAHLGGFIKRNPQYKERAKRICEGQRYPTFFSQLTDDQAQWVYHQLIHVPANVPPWGGQPATNGYQRNGR